MSAMKAVGIKALKNELSRYVQMARQGEIILVLDRDEVVAELRRPQTATWPGADRWETTLAVLEAEGVLRRARGPGPRLSELVPYGPAVPAADRILQETRDDRV